MACMILAILWLGLFPQGVLNTAEPALKVIQERAGSMSDKSGQSAVYSDVLTHAQTSHLVTGIQGSGQDR